ncbi:hypothetical protein HPB52_013932 [Rhipicephalus sanguineus]|uniref:CCHC-type domain-containing protein n=1 Tax=Rhipicephalus sanguineus TaxID=34632 RepID=A0A9D4PWH1_RHISA|nr:hypothetical protein HPB52_013932 [Rhipicephalus sanguineus]
MRGCSKSKGKPNQRSQKTQRDQTALTCKWCGSTTHPPSRTMSPGNGNICSVCGKKGHFAAVCLSASPRKKKSTHQAVLEEVYLGQYTDQQDSGPWRTDVTVNGLPMKFKVDTRADVTAIPTSLYNEQVMGNLKQAKKQLLGPGRTKITLCWIGRSRRATSKKRRCRGRGHKEMAPCVPHHVTSGGSGGKTLSGTGVCDRLSRARVL